MFEMRKDVLKCFETRFQPLLMYFYDELES